MYNIKSILFSSRRRHTRLQGDWSSDVCSSDLSEKNLITFGESWNVQAYTITQIASLSGPFAGTTTQYNELGYLADQLFANPGNSDLQQAIWAVLGTGGTANSNYTSAVNFINTHPTYMTSDV